jgi:hypothetical protein
MEQWSDPVLGSEISKQNLLIACVKKKKRGPIRDPGSGVFLYSPDPGSGTLIRDGAMVGSGSGIKRPGSATLVAMLVFDAYRYRFL